MIARFYYEYNDDILLITEHKTVFSWYKAMFLKEVQYRGKTYFNYPKPSIRIAKSSIMRDFKRCEIIF